ncbi:DUF2076 domain-containing protein [Azospirillum sp.]|uniref:DUF2076 domain-containing protein n=1 Tax=Azospirillum sp. TaxID=34012 RepID=UPI002D682E49|nr:DUF2076 domain-containing protein [Azospirillum sp.]HYD68874.1 DUF2076 domain-containing protein [Azospirillum sp.]
MTPEERNVIEDLFRRLRQSETQPRDPEAERLIRDSLQAQPGAAYYLAQSVLVQQHALTAAQQRIDELERQLQDAQRQQPAQQGGGGLFGSLFGSARPPEPQRPRAGSVPHSTPGYPPAPIGQAQGGPAPGGPWGAPPSPAFGQQGRYPQPGYPQAGYPQPGYPQQPMAARGDGFLAGAATTAMGVAGGMLAASAISSMLSGGSSPFGGPDAGASQAASHDESLPDENHVQQASYEPDEGDLGGDDGGDDSWI